MSENNNQRSSSEGLGPTGPQHSVGWFDMSKIGNVLRGRLLGQYQRRDDLRAGGFSTFYQVLLSAPCLARVERGEDARVKTAITGEVVNVNHGPSFRAWEGFAAQMMDGAIYEVQVEVAGEKIDLGQGKRMHNLNLSHVCSRPPEKPAYITLYERLAENRDEHERVVVAWHKLSCAVRRRKLDKKIRAELRGVVAGLSDLSDVLISERFHLEEKLKIERCEDDREVLERAAQVATRVAGSGVARQIELLLGRLGGPATRS
jgi:hypothetical protein